LGKFHFFFLIFFPEGSHKEIHKIDLELSVVWWGKEMLGDSKHTDPDDRDWIYRRNIYVYL